MQKINRSRGRLIPGLAGGDLLWGTWVPKYLGISSRLACTAS